MRDKPSVASPIDTLKSDYIDKLSTDAAYSLVVDPENQYNFGETTKKFIKHMVNCNDVIKVCKILKINPEEGQKIYFTDGVRSEIMRLKSAVYHRQFAGRMINLDEIGGYLTAVLMDNVLDCDKADLDQKIKISKLLIDLNDRKNKIVEDPNAIDVIPNNINDEIKDLSVDAIKSLLEAKNKKKENHKAPVRDAKDEIISQIKEKNNLTDEEAEALQALSTKELFDILKEGA